MATRSRIGIQLADESILSVYHHWDGYPEWLGRILTTHYNSKSLAEELIDGGSMSCCWTDERWNDSGVKGVYGPNYYSYRGDNEPPVLDASLEEYLSDGEEFAYLFRDGEWVCYDRHEFEPELVEIPAGALAV